MQAVDAENTEIIKKNKLLQLFAEVLVTDAETNWDKMGLITVYLTVWI